MPVPHEVNSPRTNMVRRLIEWLVIALITTVTILGLAKYKQNQIHYATPFSFSRVFQEPKSWPASMPPDRKHAGRAIRIMTMGDSITYGNVNKTKASGGYREALRRLSVRPIIFVGCQMFGYAAVAHNEGYPSWGLSDIAGIAGPEASKYKPDIILFMAGVNDFSVRYRETPAEALAHEEECIKAIAKASPRTEIFVATLIPVVNNNGVQPSQPAELSRLLPSLITCLQNEGINCRLVDMANNSHLIPEDYDAMGVHPDDAGCVKEARVWADALNTDPKLAGL